MHPGDHFHHGDCRLIYEGGATITANLCCQITTEQFYEVQLTHKHAGQTRSVIIHCALVKGFKVVLIVSVSGLRGFIIIIQQRRLHLAGKRRRRGSIGAFTKLCYPSVIISLQNSANLLSVFMLFNVLMVMAARDFIFRHTHTHTHSSCHYAGADCDPTPSQIRIRIAACALVLHQFEPSFR